MKSNRSLKHRNRKKTIITEKNDIESKRSRASVKQGELKMKKPRKTKRNSFSHRSRKKNWFQPERMWRKKRIQE